MTFWFSKNYFYSCSKKSLLKNSAKLSDNAGMKDPMANIRRAKMMRRIGSSFTGCSGNGPLGLRPRGNCWNGTCLLCRSRLSLINVYKLSPAAGKYDFKRLTIDRSEWPEVRGKKNFIR